MSSYLPSDVIKLLRLRKVITQNAIVQGLDLSIVDMSRIENRHQNPTIETLTNLLEQMGIDYKSFFLPFMENQTTELIGLRQNLLYYLDRASENIFAFNKTKDLIKELEETGLYNTNINHQFLLSCTATIGAIDGKNLNKIIELANDGIVLTYPEFNIKTFKSNLLILEEAQLLHVIALANRKNGDLLEATRLLEQMREGIILLPKDDREKEKLLAPVLLSLSQCHMDNGDYKRALEISKEGYDVVSKRNKGFLTPDLIYNIACCNSYMGEHEDSSKLLTQAYFGFSLLRRYEKCKELVEYAKDEFKIQIETYGAENLNKQLPEPNFTFGKNTECKSIGRLLSAFFSQTNMTQSQLCEGICSVSNLNKILNDNINGSPYFLEALMERLGRHIDSYFDTFLSVEDFFNKQTRDEANALIANRKYSEAEVLINKLKNEKSFQRDINKQFIMLAEVAIYRSKHNREQENIDKIYDVLRHSNKKFDLSNVPKTYLTYYEVSALNKLACAFCETDKRKQGLRLFEDLIENMDKHYVDELAKMRSYTTILYNYSKFLGMEGRYKEALEVVDKGEELCIIHGHLRLLPGFAINRACDLLWMSKSNKEESLPYFAQAYYGDMLYGRLSDAKVISDYVRDELGIVLN